MSQLHYHSVYLYHGTGTVATSKKAVLYTMFHEGNNEVRMEAFPANKACRVNGRVLHSEVKRLP